MDEEVSYAESVEETVRCTDVGSGCTRRDALCLKREEMQKRRQSSCDEGKRRERGADESRSARVTLPRGASN